MPPKGSTSRADKLSQILQFLRNSRTCHTLKELEKSIPANISSINNSMLVKDFLKELTDENLVQLDKIGTVNWYWTFGNVQVLDLQRQKTQLTTDLERSQSTIQTLSTQKTDLEIQLSAFQTDTTYQHLLQQAATLTHQLTTLRQQKQALEHSLAGGVEAQKHQLQAWQVETGLWTDNIYILEGYLRDKMGVDRETMTAWQRECYGEEYVEGEGLRELDDLMNMSRF